MDRSPLDLSARDLLSALRLGACTATALVEELAARIGPDPLGVFRSLDLDGAARAAELHDRRPASGSPAASLAGLPLSIKDLEPTAGLPTSYGFYRDGGPGPRRNGLFARRCQEAGALVFGKTNTPAFGHKDTSENLLGPPTRNPRSPEHTAGGSSGGAAAAVAAGLGPLAHATDAAGSARIPAALCGVVGFKPTVGTVPRLPSTDLWGGRAHHGVIGRSVDDVRLLFDAVRGPDPRDPLSQVPARPAVVTPLPRACSTLSLFGQRIDSRVAEVFLAAVDRLRRGGVSVEPYRGEPWPDPVDPNRAVTAARFHRRLGRLWRESPTMFDDTLSALVEEGAGVTVGDLMAADECRNELHGLACDLFGPFDALLSPTMPTTAWEHGVDCPSIDGVRVSRKPGGRWPDLLLANLLGWPAITVPCGTVNRLPVGLHIMMPRGADLGLLTFAVTAERLLAPESGAPSGPSIDSDGTRA